MNRLLASYPITSTGDATKAQFVLSREFLDVRVKEVQPPRDFHMEMSGLHLGKTFIGFNRFATKTQVDPGEVEDSLFLVLGMGMQRQFTLMVTRSSAPRKARSSHLADG